MGIMPSNRIRQWETIFSRNALPKLPAPQQIHSPEAGTDAKPPEKSESKKKLRTKK